MGIEIEWENANRVGLRLDSIREPLFPVARRHGEKPVRAIKNFAERLFSADPNSVAEYGLKDEGDAVYEKYHRLPLRAFRQFSFDELCKLRFSSFCSMDEAVEKLFESDPSYEVVRKIGSSLWRWSAFRGDWNQLVAAYDGIRRFHIDEFPYQFEVRFDYTMWCHRRGLSKYSETFLDGVFAYLVHYKGQHVMTVGFVVAKDYRILITQLQLKQPKGNRFLFKYPINHMSVIIKLFQRAFPQHQIAVVEGNSLVERLARDYLDGQTNAKRYAFDYYKAARLAKDSKSRERHLKNLEEKRQQFQRCMVGLQKLETNRPRLCRLYGSLGKFQTEGEMTAQGLTFRLVA